MTSLTTKDSLFFFFLQQQQQKKKDSLSNQDNPNMLEKT